MTAALRRARIEPLFGTPRSPERPTLGPRVVEVMRRQGKPAFPHQEHIFNVALEIDPDTGLLAYDEVVVIGPRQGTGKSEMVMGAMTYRCTGFDRTLSTWCSETFGVDVPEPGPQRVLYAAQNADEARKKWRNVHWARLGENPGSFYYGKVTATLQTNREQMTWANRSTWAPTSSTAKTGGTGDTTDMPVIDEAWAQKDSGLETAIKATMLTRPWGQMWVLSMIPGLARVPGGRKDWQYLADKRDAGRKAVARGERKGVAFFDYCAAPDWQTMLNTMDPYDPAVWYQCIPSMGYGNVTEAGVRALSRMPLTEFAPELLGVEAESVETPATWDVVSEQTWGTEPGLGLWDPQSRIVDGPFTRSFHIEIDNDRRYAWICVAGKRQDAHWHVEVVEPGGLVPQQTLGIEWVVPRAVDMNAKWRPAVWTVCAGRQAESLVPLLEAAGLKVHVIPRRDMAGACGRMYDATGQRASDDARVARTGPWTGVFHLGQYELADGWRNARKYDHGQGAFTLVNKADGPQLCPLYGVIGAMEGFERFGGRVRKSAIY